MKRTLAPCLVAATLLSACAFSPENPATPDHTTTSPTAQKALAAEINAEINRLLSGGDGVPASAGASMNTAQPFTVGSGDTVLGLLRRANAPESLFYDLPEGDQRRLSRLSPGDTLVVLGSPAAGFTGLGISKDGDWWRSDRNRSPYRLTHHTDAETPRLKVHDLPLNGTLEKTLAGSDLDAPTQARLVTLLSRGFPAEALPDGWLRLRLNHRTMAGVETQTPELTSAALSIAPAPMFMVRHQRPGASPAYYNGNGERLNPEWISHPLRGNYRISSEFDPQRRHPVTGRVRPHNGRDFAARRGTPIVAATDGVVLHAGWRGSWGRLVVLSHGNGLLTRYAHLSDTADLSEGDRVQRGQVIGKVGTTGLSTGPHLHFEIYERGTAKNPAHFEPGEIGALAGIPLHQEDRAFFARYTRLESRSLARLPQRGMGLVAQMRHQLYGAGGPDEAQDSDP